MLVSPHATRLIRRGCVTYATGRHWERARRALLDETATSVHRVRVRCVESFSDLGGADERAGGRPGRREEGGRRACVIQKDGASHRSSVNMCCVQCNKLMMR